MIRGLACFLILAVMTPPIFAGNRCNVQVQAVQLQSGLIVSPFAIPVGVPVTTAQASPYAYGFTPAGTGYSAAGYSAASVPKDAMYDAVADRVIAKLKAAGFGGSSFQAQALPERPSLVAANCAKCHSGASAAKGYRVDVPLSETGKLKAIAKMLDDNPQARMPKGKILDAQTLGLMLQELAGKAVPVPPAPVAEPTPEAKE